MCKIFEIFPFSLLILVIFISFWFLHQYCCSVIKLCLILCHPIDCSMSGFPALHYLPEFPQTHVHWVDEAIQPSHPLSPLLLLPSIFPSITVFSNIILIFSNNHLCFNWCSLFFLFFTSLIHYLFSTEYVFNLFLCF